MSLKKTFLLVLTLVPELVLANVESEINYTDVLNEEILQSTVDGQQQDAGIVETFSDPSLEIPVDINPAVQSRLYHLTASTEHKRQVRAVLNRIPLFADALIKYATQYKVPQEIIAVAVVESTLQPNVRSKGGHSTGLWQFLPGTARRFGLRVGGKVDERLNPEKSTEAAMKYLRYLYNMFGDWRLVIKAYNIGEGALSGRIRKMGTNDPWVIEGRQRRGAGYLTKVMAIIVLLKHPEMLN